MSRFEGPQGIVTNGLVLNLDAGDPDSYTRSQPPFVEVLVVAGGGGGGARHAGGGGAGGLIYNSAYQLTNAATITVTVGAGGAGTFNSFPSFVASGGTGSNSVFGSLTAIGGGGGGSFNSGQPGTTGGSGGGNINTSQIPGTPGQGFNGGGSNTNASPYNHGGGGGASEPGQNGQANKAGDGGDGQAFAISGTSTYYAGGGAGGSHPPDGTPAVGGLGGGGNEGPNNGTANTGGGGGGGTLNTGGGDGSGGNGGSGIVIVRYPGLPAATGGTITYLNGYTIHTFTSSGTFTPYLWNDVSGNNNSGSLVNGPIFNSFQNGGFIAFDGVDDYAFTTGFPTANFMTLSCWFRTNIQQTNKYFVAFGKNLTSNNGFDLTFQNTQIGSFISVTGANGGSNLYTTNYYDNIWHNLVTTYDGSAARTYYDGNLVVSRTGMSGNLDIEITKRLNIGSWVNNGSNSNCNLAQVQIYNRAISATEVLQNYNAQKNRFGL